MALPSNPIPEKQLNSNSGLPFGYVPAYLPGSASLVEELDSTLLIVLRDGRHLVGTLRSFDQFSNMVLEHTCERRMVLHDGICYYTDEPLGLYVVRGDSMVLLGQLSDFTPSKKEVTREELDALRAKHGSGALQWDFDADLTA